MIVKLLTEHHLEFLSLKGGCTGSRLSLHMSKCHNVGNLMHWLISYFADVDECEQGTSACDSLCQNTIGSYRCACLSGYVLNMDGKTCRGKYR